MATESGKPSFLNLPAEIRRKVFRYLYQGPINLTVVDLNPGKCVTRSLSPETKAIFTCKLFYEEALPILLATPWFRIDCAGDDCLGDYFPKVHLGISKLRLLVGSVPDPQFPAFYNLREVEIEQFYFEVGNLREKHASTPRRLTNVIKQTRILQWFQKAFAQMECHPTLKVEIRISWDQFERSLNAGPRAEMTWGNGEWYTMNRDIVRPPCPLLSKVLVTDQ